jgi:hypothetical protein
MPRFLKSMVQFTGVIQLYTNGSVLEDATAGDAIAIAGFSKIKVLEIESFESFEAELIGIWKVLELVIFTFNIISSTLTYPSILY